MHLYIVAGAPGSGKSTVADLLAPALQPVPALLDKDTLFSGFVAEVQRNHRRDSGEREGSWYDEHVKVHEYEGLAAATRQIRALGCPVILVAPFTSQIRSAELFESWLATLGGPPATLIWVRTDPETLKARLLARGSDRDSGKLTAFEEFLARMQPDVPPPVAHRAIDNADGAAPLSAQLSALAEELNRGSGR